MEVLSSFSLDFEDALDVLDRRCLGAFLLFSVALMLPASNVMGSNSEDKDWFADLSLFG